MEMNARVSPEGGRVSPRRTETTVIFEGHARLPQTVAPSDSPSVVSIELEVDTASGTIVGISVEGALPLAIGLVSDVLLGRKIADGPEAATEGIRQRYVGPSEKGLCAAVTSAYYVAASAARKGSVDIRGISSESQILTPG